MIICSQYFSKDTIDKIQDMILNQPDISRRRLSQQVCELLNWRDSLGRLKEMSCRVALLKLHRDDHIILPEARGRPPSRVNQVQMDFGKVDIIPAIHCSIEELGHIEIEQIHSRYSKSSKIWNDLMNRYHYLSSGPLCGSQIRYLINSEHYGYLGGFAFTSASWSLQARDQWIGWDKTSQKAYLNKIICNSRFLIVPYFHVKNLASHSLSMCIKRLAIDWEKRYGIAPVLLETFVEGERFNGACYRAANWIYVGKSKGRGRSDSTHESTIPKKDIYVYPLRYDACQILRDGKKKALIKEKEWIDWADEEFDSVDLGDERRNSRLKIIIRDFFARPQSNIPQACQSMAKTKAAYRFLEEENNSMDKILKPHYQSSLNRIKNEKVVLSVQDTTFLNYSTHPATENLGLIGTRGDGIIGLIVHDTMMFNIEGTPLGLLDVQCWTRDPKDFGKNHFRNNLSIEQKESNKWLKSFKATQKVQSRYPNTQLVSVGDREADIYELFYLAHSIPDSPKLLIRAEHNRVLSDGQMHLCEYISSQEVSGIQIINVPRKKNQKAREAKLEIRFCEVKLKAPWRKKNLCDLPINVISVQEIDAPEGVEPLHWILLTTCEVTTFEHAIEKLRWYCIRWGIEIYHKTLKSGCKIENRQLGSADRIESCLAIDMIVAWRIYNLTKLGREVPDMPCTVFFEDDEWKALVAYKTQNPNPPKNIPTLKEAIHMVASLGGFLGRKSDGNPGTQTLWLGLQRLDDLTAMYKVFTSDFILHPSNSPPPVPS